MKKIITNLSPFILEQTLYVIENNEVIEEVKAKMSDLISTIFSLADKYQIKDVGIRGPRQFCNGVIKNIQSEELIKYATNKLNVYNLEGE